MNSATILSIRNLCIEFRTDRGIVRAVDGISFDVRSGETIGIVGESGCGKSVTSLSVLGLLPFPAGRISGGGIHFSGQNLNSLSEAEYRHIRGKQIAMIFQDPMTALNPVLRIGDQMREVLQRHLKLSRTEAAKRSLDLLKTVGITSAKKRLRQYPHELSGGMRQRVMIALALSCEPKLILADEPTTALDVTTQAQVLTEFSRLQKKFNMAVVLVTHDLGVIAETCEYVHVMYCGKIVESATIPDLFKAPQHPYTQGLLASIPSILEEKVEKLPMIPGMVPDLLHLPKGCRFAPRCNRAQDRCHQEEPTLKKADVNESMVACFFPGNMGASPR